MGDESLDGSPGSTSTVNQYPYLYWASGRYFYHLFCMRLCPVVRVSSSGRAPTSKSTSYILHLLTSYMKVRVDGHPATSRAPSKLPPMLLNSNSVISLAVSHASLPIFSPATLASRQGYARYAPPDMRRRYSSIPFQASTAFFLWSALPP